jgi:uncharacterized protein YecE (DUF72 family)
VWLWETRTPGAFTFHVKAYGGLTGHAVDPKTLPADIRGIAGNPSGKSVYVKEREVLRLISQRFRETLMPLARAGKLGVIVFQFPPWFDCKSSNMDYVLFCKQLMAELSIAVEFRHGSWLSGARASEVFAFLNWLKKGIATALRYAYSYSDAELREFMPAVKEADRQAKKTYAMFNNCHRGSATANAARLKELLREA